MATDYSQSTHEPTRRGEVATERGCTALDRDGLVDDVRHRSSDDAGGAPGIDAEDVDPVDGEPTESTARADDPYTVRRYEPEDREAILELFELVTGERDEEWFRWRYEDNPYVNHVPIVVVTGVEGEIVATKPCFALEFRVGDETVVALQPEDDLVHPDHRRRGLHSRTTEWLKSHYRDRDASVFVGFTERAPHWTGLRHGWEIVGDVPTYTRVQCPSALIDGDGDDAVVDQLGRLAALGRPVLAGYLRARDAVTSGPDDVTVDRLEEIPVETFVALAERSVPGTVHANRDETFYEWRFSNPRRSYEAYVASRRGRPLAGVIVERRRRNGTQQAGIVDVAPLGRADGRTDGLRALLERVVADHRDAEEIVAMGEVIPAAVLEEFGFRSDLSIPLSTVSASTSLVAYPMTDEDDGHEWTLEGLAIADPANWTVTDADRAE